MAVEGRFAGAESGKANTTESGLVTDTDLRLVRIAGSCTLAGGLVFMLFNTIAEGLYPNYNVGTDALSALGYLGSNTALLWSGYVLAAGLLALSGMYLLFYRSQFRLGLGRAKWVGLLFMLPGAGTILVSLFPANSGLGSLHLIGALIAFIFGGLSAVYAFKLTSAPFRYFSVVLGAAILVALVVSFVPTGVYGLLERLVVYPYILWAVAFGSYLLAVPGGRR